MYKNKGNKIYMLISATAIILVTVINISLIFNNNVWCDEAASINLSYLSISEIIEKATMDFHPPLYYLILKLFGIIFQDALWGYKLASVLPMIATIIVVNIWIQQHLKQNQLWATTIFTFLMGLGPCNMGKNVEVRMYTWAVLWVTIFLLSSWEIRKGSSSKKIYVILLLFGTLACYTHYFALLCTTVIFLFTVIDLLQNKSINLKWYCMSCFGIFIMFTPWIPCLYKQMHSNMKGWTIHLDVHFEYFLNTFRYPFEGDYSASFSSEFTGISWIIIVSLAIISLTKLYKDKSPDSLFIRLGIECLLSFVLVVCIAYVLSKLFHPILMPRYLFPAISMLWLSIALMVSDINITNQHRALVIALIFVMGVNAYGKSRTREYRTGTTDTLNFFESNLSSDDVLVNDLEICACWELNYYFPEYDNYYIENNILYANDGITPWYLNTSFDLYSSPNTIWYLCKNDIKIDTEKLQQNGYQIESVYNGNLDNYYHFKVYKISK